MEQETERATETIAEFVKRLRIQSRASRVHENPNVDNDGWGKDARHWSVSFERTYWHEQTAYPTRSLKTERFGVFFSQGSAHKAVPTAEDVLDCLAMDADVLGRDFEDWASDLGMDSDSRKAEKTFNICVEQSRKLQKFLGPFEFRNLLENVERL